jgi:hypothetical protein
MKTISRTAYFSRSSSDVFHAIDDLGVTGSHMTQSSMMMMGSKLKLEYLSKNHTGLNSKYRWSGKMMGIPMDFTVLVTLWNEGRRKVWETVGDCKLILYTWYRMELQLEESYRGTKALLSITYTRPKNIFSKILSLLLADVYCIWCLRKMLRDAKQALVKIPMLHSPHSFERITRA